MQLIQRTTRLVLSVYLTKRPIPSCPTHLLQNKNGSLF